MRKIFPKSISLDFRRRGLKKQKALHEEGLFNSPSKIRTYDQRINRAVAFHITHYHPTAMSKMVKDV
jgi:hypothetical protein